MKWTAIVIAVAIAQWMVFVMASLFSRARAPKKGLRGTERWLMVSTAVFLALWLVGFDGRVLWRWKPAGPTVQASAAVATFRGSCATIENEMPESDVQSRLGKPDEIRANEEVRGPGSSIWIYRDSRCAVHMFDGKVEFVE